jgi:glutamyl-tRNA reductase
MPPQARAARAQGGGLGANYLRVLSVLDLSDQCLMAHGLRVRRAMTTTFVTGINYRSAPVALREQLALDRDDITEVLADLRSGAGLGEAMILSTCNRVEIYGVAEPPGPRRAFDLLCERRGMAPEALAGLVYTETGDEAIRHCFRVASSLDSMIVGEPQVLGQVKEAYGLARRCGAAGGTLHRLFTQAFAVAKRVRTETAVAQHAVSVPCAAVELAKKIFGDFRGRSALLIGAGEMGELAARHLMDQGVSRLSVANRTWSRAVEVARALTGRPVPFDRWIEELAGVDIVITSASVRRPLVTVETVRAALRTRRSRPFFFIDIAVPRNVDEAVSALGDVFCYDVDDLQGVVTANLHERRREAARAEVLVSGEVDKFLAGLRDRDVVPAIVSLRRRVEAVGETELARALAHLPDVSPETRQAFEALTSSIVNKILHPPTARLRDAAHDGRSEEWIAIMRELFALAPAEPATEGLGAGHLRAVTQ